MYKITYNLKSPNSEKETLIFIFITLKTGRLKLSTQQTIIPDLWDFKRKRPILSKPKLEKYKNLYPDIEEKILSIKQNLENLSKEVSRYLLGKDLENEESSINELKDHLINYLNPQKEENTYYNGIVDYLNNFILNTQKGKRKQPNGKLYKISTIYSYKDFRRLLVQYQNKLNTTIYWENIDRSFYNEFILFLEGLNLTSGSIGRIIKLLKSTMRFAFDEGLHSNEEFRKRYFIVFKNHKKKIPLSLGEVEKMEQLNLPIWSKIDLARDVFLMGCYFGLRISDLKRICPQYIKSDSNGKFIEIKTVKTEQVVLIPISQKAKRILEKYQYSIPKLSEQSLNTQLKIIGTMIGLNKERVRGFSMHVSRHTFATLTYQLGIPSRYIMMVTGHKSESSFLIYINMKPKETINELRAFEYFN